MATTFYLTNITPDEPKPNSKSTAQTQVLTTTLGGGQDPAAAGTIYPLLMSTTPGSSNVALSNSFTEPGSAHYMWVKAWISPPLAAQTLSGTLTFVADFLESSINVNMMPGINVYIWKSDDTLGSTLYSGTSATEADTSAGTLQTFFSAVTITTTTVSAGDRIVIEVQSYDNNTKTSAYTHGFGFNGAVGSGYESYVQFSMDIAFPTTKISKTLGCPYKVMSGVSTAQKLIYKISNYVSSKDTHIFNIFNTVTSQAERLVYNILGTVSVSNIIRMVYNVRTRATSAKSFLYTIMGRITKALSAIYIIRNLISASSKAVYHIRALISSLKGLPYAIRALVSHSDKFIYTVRAFVSNTNRFLYEIGGIISKVGRFVYNSWAFVSKTGRLVYGIRGFVQSARKLIYNIQILIPASRVLVYGVRTFVSSVRKFPYNIGGKLVGVLRIVYNIMNRQTASLSFPYSIRGIVQAVGKALYNIRGWITKSVSSLYHIRSFVTSARKLVYNIVSQTSVSANISFPYTIFKKVCPTRTFLYKLGTQTKTWAAAAAGNASNDANWSPYGKPSDGDDIVFNSTSVANCTWDLAGSFGNFTIASGYTGTITQQASFSITSYSQVAGTFMGSTSYWLTDTGQFSKTGGTITPGPLQISFTSNSGTFSSSTTEDLYSLHISGNITVTMSFYLRTGGLTVDTGKTLTLQGTVYIYSTGQWSNSGTITGSGSLIFMGLSSQSYNFGNINCPITLRTWSSSSNSNTFTLTANANFGSTLTVDSIHATYTMTLSLNGYSLTANGISFGTRGIISANSSTITCSGNLSMTSTTSVFTQGGYCRVYGTANISNGTWNVNYDGRASSINQTGGTITVAPGKVLYYDTTDTFTGGSRSGDILYWPRVCSAIYHIRTSISKANNLVYAIRGLIAKAGKLVYVIRGFMSRAVAFTYRLAIKPSPYYVLASELYDYFKGHTIPGGELEGFMIYRERPKTKPLFFPCLIIEMESTNKTDMFSGEYIEGATINIEIMFTKKRSISLTTPNGILILTGESLARYYRDKLLALTKAFTSDTINTAESQIVATTFGPSKPQHTLYGARLTMQFMFKGGDLNWMLH